MTRLSRDDRGGRRLIRTSTPGVFKRGSRYVVCFRDPGGTPRKRSARTLAEARDLKAALTADIIRGEYRAASRVTFRDYVQSWVVVYSGRTAAGIRESTMVEYRRALGVNPDGSPRADGRGALGFFGRSRLAEIEPIHVKTYLAKVAAGGASKNTLRNHLAPLRCLFATAVEEGVIRYSPTAGIRLPRSEQEHQEEQRKALTEQELARLIAAMRPERQLLIRFLACTGLRIGEAVALEFGDIDFGHRRVQVRRRIYQGEVALPKSRYGRRDVPLPTGLARELWQLRKDRRGRDNEPLFLGRGGRPLDASTAFRDLKTAARSAGVPWASLHTLRHTCATMLFRNGLNAKQMQAWLGHHSPAFTLATYVHLLPDDLPDPEFMDVIVARDFPQPPEFTSQEVELVSRLDAAAAQDRK